mmetsp:Transcript_6333/g.10587  ORF Transcript_6333/g.10587 Transcript_6333/m.10587 type:complete len:95 (+) Transcript_6333:1919-2203(+)
MEVKDSWVEVLGILLVLIFIARMRLASSTRAPMDTPVIQLENGMADKGCQSVWLVMMPAIRLVTLYDATFVENVEDERGKEFFLMQLAINTCVK